jgi:hypothetical protein
MMSFAWNKKVLNAIEAWHDAHEDTLPDEHLAYLDPDLTCMCCGVDFSDVVWENAV